MGSVFGNSNSINYLSQLLSNQVLQNQFNNTVAQSQGNSNNTIQQSTQNNAQLGSALSSLANLINSSATSTTATTQLSALDNYTINNLTSKGSVDKTKLNNLVDMVTGNTGDLLYTRTDSNDPNITAKNKVAISGADLSNLLNQAALVSQRGDDVNAYIDAATEVAEKGDYDDLRRFISVTNSVMANSQNLDKYYDFSKQILNKRSYDFESNVFALQTLVNYGASMDNGIKVLKNMETTGLDGRNNLVDLNRVLINEKNKGGSVSNLITNMANSTDTRAFLNDYMSNNNLKSTAPDFNKFNRIERIDGEDMIIKEGESAALFSQAISSTQGLLPESVLYWSSLQNGAISNGSSYLDLSKLKAGTYDIYVKIGNYAGGTDTAKKRVVVLPKEDVEVDGGGVKPEEGKTDPIILPEEGSLRITVEKGSAGLDSDLFINKNGTDTLVTTKAQTNQDFTYETGYKKGDALDFFIKTHGDSWGLGTYDHGTNTENSPSGKAYYKKEELSPTSWRIRFEDLPEEKSDFDYDDVVIKVELLPKKQADTSVKNTTNSDNTKGAKDDVLLNYGNTTDTKKKKFDDSDLEALFNSPSLSEKIVKTLSECDKSLSEKYKKKEVSLVDILFDTTYKRQKEELSRSLKLSMSKKEAESFCTEKNIDPTQSKLFLDSFEFASNSKETESVDKNPEKK